MTLSFGPANEAIRAEPDERSRRIAQLEELLHDIALMADNHKRSTLHVAGENVALVNIRNMAAISIGLDAAMLERGTPLAEDPEFQ